MYFNSFSDISFSSIPEIASFMGNPLIYIAAKSVVDAENSITKGFINTSGQSAFIRIEFKKNLKKLSWLLASIQDGN